MKRGCTGSIRLALACRPFRLWHPQHAFSSHSPFITSKESEDTRSGFEEWNKEPEREHIPSAEGRRSTWQGSRVQLNSWQRAAVALGSAIGAGLNPARADLVGALGETTGAPAFTMILKRMKRNTEGQMILLDRPRVTSSAMARAWDMPPNTFGAAYAKFMGDRNFSADDRPAVRFMESEEIAYVATRAREVHDFWHVLFNCPTNVSGELALKMVEFQQLLLPMCLLSVAGGSWRLKPRQRNLLFTHYFPWAVQASWSCVDLMCIYYEKHLDHDLVELRKQWGIIPASKPPKHSHP